MSDQGEKPLEAARKILEEETADKEYDSKDENDRRREYEEIFEDRINRINELVKSRYADCRKGKYKDDDEKYESLELEREVFKKIDSFLNFKNMY